MTIDTTPEYDAVAAEWLARKTRAAGLRSQRKIILLEALKSVGISKVEITFAGEGDSGQIEEVVFDDDPANTPSVSVKIPYAKFGEDKPEEREVPLAEAVEQFCWEVLEEEHDGWEINDGGHGSFVFDVPNDRITLEMKERFIDYHTSSHEF